MNYRSLCFIFILLRNTVLPPKVDERPDIHNNVQPIKDVPMEKISKGRPYTLYLGFSTTSVGLHKHF